MIKHQAAEQLAEEEEKPYMGSEFDSLEEELNRFSISIDGSLKTPAKPFTGSLQAQSALQPRPELAQDTPGDPSAHS